MMLCEESLVATIAPSAVDAPMSLFRHRPELLARFRAGERAALVEVYDAYAERVANLVRQGCQLQKAGAPALGGLFVSPDDFLDVIHEVFIKAFSPAARQGYDGVREFGPYVLMITRNVMVDWVRRRGSTTSFTAEWFAALPSPDPAPDEPAPWWAAERLAVLERYLAGLPRELREVHRSRYEQGLSQEAAAQALGISRQTLRTAEQRLRRGLAQAIAEADEEPLVDAPISVAVATTRNHR
jgi:RNA polymerase sigma-70 factor (ECF subfamily)